MAIPPSLTLHQMVIEVTNNGAGSSNDQQQPRQPNQHKQHPHLPHQSLYLQSSLIDVRMKRHPELQPYVPSDRERYLTNNIRKAVHNGIVTGGGGSGLGMSGRSIVTKHAAMDKAKTKTISNQLDAKPADIKSKKYVSMTRLDQLAQPKKVFSRNSAQTTSKVPLSSLTSSNSTSNTASNATSITTSNAASINTSITKFNITPLTTPDATPNVSTNVTNTALTDLSSDMFSATAINETSDAVPEENFEYIPNATTDARSDAISSATSDAKSDAISSATSDAMSTKANESMRDVEEELEEELEEAVRRDEMERRSRQQFVENILSKFKPE